LFIFHFVVRHTHAVSLSFSFLGVFSTLDAAAAHKERREREGREEREKGQDDMIGWATLSFVRGSDAILCNQAAANEQ
jgi:hypothetical protein